MIKLEMKNCNLVSTEKQQEYQNYHLKRLININYEDQDKNQIKVTEDHRKQLVESNKLI